MMRFWRKWYDSSKFADEYDTMIISNHCESLIISKVPLNLHKHQSYSTKSNLRVKVNSKSKNTISTPNMIQLFCKFFNLNKLKSYPKLSINFIPFNIQNEKENNEISPKNTFIILPLFFSFFIISSSQLVKSMIIHFAFPQSISVMFVCVTITILFVGETISCPRSPRGPPPLLLRGPHFAHLRQ